MPGESGTAALLGREREQAELYDALSLALKGEPQIVLVSGDAGIGKTTLVADLARRAEELGFSVFAGSLSRHRGGHRVRRRDRGGARAGRGGSRTSTHDPARAGCARCSTPRRRGARSATASWRTCVRPCSRPPPSGPVLLVLEDMHWAGRVDPGLRGGALPHRTRSAALRAHGPQRRPPSPTPGAEGARRDRPGPRRSARRSGAPGPGQHRRHRGVDVGGAADPAAGPVRAGALGGQPALRRGARSPPGPERSPTSCPTCSWRGSTRWPTGRVSCSAIASVDGTRVDIDTLARGRGHRPREAGRVPPRPARREPPAQDAGDSLEFRHGLLREAVYDDLLPDERTRLHAELAGDPPGEGRRGSGARSGCC